MSIRSSDFELLSVSFYTLHTGIRGGWSSLWVIPDRTCLSILLYPITFLIPLLIYSTMFGLRLSAFYYIITVIHIITTFIRIIIFLRQLTFANFPNFISLSFIHLSTSNLILFIAFISCFICIHYYLIEVEILLPAHIYWLCMPVSTKANGLLPW